MEAANYLLALKDAGAQVSTDYGAAEAPFRAGETAFWPNGPWALGDYKKDLGDKLGVAPIPSGTAPSAPLIGIDGFYINNDFSCMLCGLGFDAQVAHDFARQKKRGLQTYIKISAINYFKAKPYSFTIQSKEKDH